MVFFSAAYLNDSRYHLAVNNDRIKGVLRGAILPIHKISLSN